MDGQTVIKMAGDAVYTILIVSAPMLLMGLAVGLLVSIFQATTQIQEQTLAFIPKIVAILLSLVLFGPWMLGFLVDYVSAILGDLSRFVG
jgi:flagellar biosynthetic protein FliQ